MVEYSVATCLIVLAAVLTAVSCEFGSQDGRAKHLKISNKTNTLKLGNSKTNTYNLQRSNIRPMQVTQVVLNVPKLKKTRKSRPPTQEEFDIKEKILDIFDKAKQEVAVDSPHFKHLRLIIEALNPKYIATERVWSVVHADPSDPDALVPLPYVQPRPQYAVDLKGETDQSIGDQLDELHDKFTAQVTWDDHFIDDLADSDDGELSLKQLAFKQLILCLDDSLYCKLYASSDEEENEDDDEDEDDEREYDNQQGYDSKQLDGPANDGTRRSLGVPQRRQSDSETQKRFRDPPKPKQQYDADRIYGSTQKIGGQPPADSKGSFRPRDFRGRYTSTRIGPRWRN